MSISKNFLHGKFISLALNPSHWQNANENKISMSQICRIRGDIYNGTEKTRLIGVKENLKTLMNTDPQLAQQLKVDQLVRYIELLTFDYSIYLKQLLEFSSESKRLIIKRNDVKTDRKHYWVIDIDLQENGLKFHFADPALAQDFHEVLNLIGLRTTLCADEKNPLGKIVSIPHHNVDLLLVLCGYPLFETVDLLGKEHYQPQEGTSWRMSVQRDLALLQGDRIHFFETRLDLLMSELREFQVIDKDFERVIVATFSRLNDLSEEKGSLESSIMEMVARILFEINKNICSNQSKMPENIFADYSKWMSQLMEIIKHFSNLPNENDLDANSTLSSADKIAKNKELRSSLYVENPMQQEMEDYYLRHQIRLLLEMASSAEQGYECIGLDKIDLSHASGGLAHIQQNIGNMREFLHQVMSTSDGDGETAFEKYEKSLKLVTLPFVWNENDGVCSILSKHFGQLCEQTLHVDFENQKIKFYFRSREDSDKLFKLFKWYGFDVAKKMDFSPVDVKDHYFVIKFYPSDFVTLLRLAQFNPNHIQIWLDQLYESKGLCSDDHLIGGEPEEGEDESESKIQLRAIPHPDGKQTLLRATVTTPIRTSAPHVIFLLDDSAELDTVKKISLELINKLSVRTQVTVVTLNRGCLIRRKIEITEEDKLKISALQGGSNKALLDGMALAVAQLRTHHAYPHFVTPEEFEESHIVLVLANEFTLSVDDILTTINTSRTPKKARARCTALGTPQTPNRRLPSIIPIDVAGKNRALVKPLSGQAGYYEKRTYQNLPLYFIDEVKPPCIFMGVQSEDLSFENDKNVEVSIRTSPLRAGQENHHWFVWPISVENREWVTVYDDGLTLNVAEAKLEIVADNGQLLAEYIREQYYCLLSALDKLLEQDLENSNQLSDAISELLKLHDMLSEKDVVLNSLRSELMSAHRILSSANIEAKSKLVDIIAHRARGIEKYAQIKQETSYSATVAEEQQQTPALLSTVNSTKATLPRLAEASTETTPTIRVQPTSIPTQSVNLQALHQNFMNVFKQAINNAVTNYLNPPESSSSCSSCRVSFSFFHMKGESGESRANWLKNALAIQKMPLACWNVVLYLFEHRGGNYDNEPKLSLKTSILRQINETYSSLGVILPDLSQFSEKGKRKKEKGKKPFNMFWLFEKKQSHIILLY